MLNWQDIDPKRLERAKEKALTPLKLDAAARTAVFASSEDGTYNTTLEGCDCVDFARTGAPCKHILRLAMELGEIDSTGMQSDPAEAEHKLLRADLLNFARNGDLYPAAQVIHTMQNILAKKRVNYRAFTELFGEWYCIEEHKGDSRVVKPYAADVKSAIDVMQRRIGKLALDNLPLNTVAAALREIGGHR